MRKALSGDYIGSIRWKRGAGYQQPTVSCQEKGAGCQQPMMSCQKGDAGCQQVEKDDRNWREVANIQLNLPET